MHSITTALTMHICLQAMQLLLCCAPVLPRPALICSASPCCVLICAALLCLAWRMSQMCALKHGLKHASSLRVRLIGYAQPHKQQPASVAALSRSLKAISTSAAGADLPIDNSSYLLAGSFAIASGLIHCLQVQVTDQPLTSMRMMDNGRVAAVGSADGSTTIVQFSDGLVDMQPNEKQALTSVSPQSLLASSPPVSPCALARMISPTETLQAC